MGISGSSLLLKRGDPIEARKEPTGTSAFPGGSLDTLFTRVGGVGQTRQSGDLGSAGFNSGTDNELQE